MTIEKFSTNQQLITACGASGRTGPTTADCRRHYEPYASTGPLQYIDTVNGVQRFRVRNDTVFDVTAHGARGGHANLEALRPGGYGAKVVGAIILRANQVLNVVVGQWGSSPLTGENTVKGGGGGGGTFIFIENATGEGRTRLATKVGSGRKKGRGREREQS